MLRASHGIEHGRSSLNCDQGSLAGLIAAKMASTFFTSPACSCRGFNSRLQFYTKQRFLSQP